MIEKKTRQAASNDANIFLSPAHYATFELSRTLLILSVNDEAGLEPIEFENLLIIDFVVQYPRIAKGMIDSFDLVLESNDLVETDLSDIFSKDRIQNHYERLSFIVSALVSRNLAHTRLPNEEDQGTYYSLTELGRKTSRVYCSKLSFLVRELASELLAHWGKRNYSSLMRKLFEQIPESYSQRLSLAQPFKIWENDE